MSSKRGGEWVNPILTIIFGLTVLDLANLAVKYQEETEKKQPKEIKAESPNSQKKTAIFVVPAKVAKPKM